MKKRSLQTREMVYIALFAVLIAVCAWVCIPAAVPFTMQTFGVFLALGLLGARRGFYAILLYILLGAVGVPVFSGFAGGPGVLLGLTGGYILGFLLSAPVYGGALKLLGDTRLARALGMLLGLLVCYAAGTAYFMAAYARMNGAIGVMTALGWCVFPFILPDLAKLALALLAAERLRAHLRL